MEDNGGGILFKTLHFAISVGTCASFLPALQLVAARRRHFECFIAVFQLLSAVMYSACDALSMARVLFVSRNDWHMISDIATETYVCFLCIHLCGLRSEETMIWLRYVAFGGAWLAKLGDGWGSVALEALLLAGFALPAGGMAMQEFATGRLAPILFPGGGANPPAFVAFLDRSLAFDRKVAPRAAGSVAVGLLLLVGELSFDTSLRILNALAHCAFGGAAYFLWRVLPCYDKNDELPTFR